MIRQMWDATHDGVSSIPVGGQLVGGYDTGSPDIQWVASDWAQFPYAVHVHIDQGFTGAPVYSATVQDVETGAYTPGGVPAWQAACTAARPTVYCNRSTLPAVLATGWRGEIWLAWPGWTVTTPLPPLPAGCSIVAVQNYQGTSYDHSVVIDPTWPEPREVTEMGGATQLQAGWSWCSKCQGLYFRPNQAKSVCPAGGTHGSGLSDDYSLLSDNTPS